MVTFAEFPVESIVEQEARPVAPPRKAYSQWGLTVGSPLRILAVGAHSGELTL